MNTQFEIVLREEDTTVEAARSAPVAPPVVPASGAGPAKQTVPQPTTGPTPPPKQAGGLALLNQVIQQLQQPGPGAASGGQETAGASGSPAAGAKATSGPTPAPAGNAAGGAAAAAQSLLNAALQSTAGRIGLAGTALNQGANAAGQVAQNNFTGAIGSVGNVAAVGALAIPGAGPAIAAAIKLVTAIPEMVSKVISSFTDRAKELAPYSGAIAGAKAQSEIALLLADIKEAQVNGQQMAELITVQTQAEIEFREIMLPVKALFVEAFANIISIIKDIRKLLGGDDEKIADPGATIWNDFLSALDGIDTPGQSAPGGPAAPPPPETRWWYWDPKRRAYVFNPFRH